MERNSEGPENLTHALLPKSSKKSWITEILSQVFNRARLIGVILQTAFISSVRYATIGPTLPTWSFGTHLFRDVIQKVLIFASRHESAVERAQKATSGTFQAPRNAKVEICYYLTSNKAIEFMRSKSEIFPAYAEEPNYIKAEWVYEKESTSYDDGIIIYYIHGGAYVVGSPQMDRKITYLLSKRNRGRTFATSYRLSPQYQFPCAVIDVISGYLFLLKRFNPEKIFILGVSAGGGLAMALLLAIREMKLPRPSGTILISPWLDQTLSFPSQHLNATYDYLPDIENYRPQYAHESMHKNPYVSPVWAEDLRNMPPILIQVGEKERLHDEAFSLAIKLHKDGNRVELEIYTDHFHAFQMFRFRASKTAHIRASEFIQRTLDSSNLRRGAKTTFCHQGVNAVTTCLIEDEFENDDNFLNDSNPVTENNFKEEQDKKKDCDVNLKFVSKI